MTGILPGTIIPWLLGGLILLLLLTTTVSFKSWREAKRSPYYFLRVQAARKMQSYLTASVFLFVLVAIASIYAWRTPADTTPRLTVLQNAKPFQSTPSDISSTDEIIAEASPDIVTINLDTNGQEIVDLPAAPANAVSDAPDILAESEAEAPVEGGPEVISEERGSSVTNIGPIYFSTDISANYQAINPGAGFTEGYFTLYATFSYESMAEGTPWSWVWKRNGQAIDGGEQLWAYGSDGPGYVYFQPEEGFHLGEHSLEVWVEDQLMSQSGFSITESVSASN